jgi:hypothetical protein
VGREGRTGARAANPQESSTSSRLLWNLRNPSFLLLAVFKHPLQAQNGVFLYLEGQGFPCDTCGNPMGSPMTSK